MDEENLIQKYEVLLYNGESMYFDFDEFEIIVSHYINENRYFDALEAQIHAKLCHPENRKLDILKVEIFIYLEEYEKASELIVEIENQTDVYDVNVYKGQLYLILDNPDKAMAQFEIAMKKCFREDEDFDFDSRIYDIPEFLIDEGYYKEALVFMHELIDAGKADAELFCQTAYCYERISEPEQAELYYEKALDENPFDEKIWISLGIFHSGNSDHLKALHAFDFALSINEKNISAAIGKSNTLIMLKEIDAAMKWTTEMLETKPNDPDLLFNLGKCHVEKNNTSKAEECFTEAIRNDPELASAYCEMAKIACGRHDYQTAVKLLEEAWNIEPGNREFTHLKGLCMIAMVSDLATLSPMLEGMKKVEHYSSDLFENGIKTFFEDKYKNAVACYHLGLIEECCKSLFEAGQIFIYALDMFFRCVPEAKNDAYIINYFGKNMKLNNYGEYTPHD
ncbi:MAG: tetratricopeptide repeat protein [Prevotellaceae bacterium]|jgi:tetratricopeptide (TPR) repeat protein|nr:tetratricopeptide repeat protein [Prevotellaceae bacterium]